MNYLTILDLILRALPIMASVLCFAAALVLLNLMRINKGAKLNRAWGLMALGSVCFGLARFVDALDQHASYAVAAIAVLMALGALFILIGAVYGRGLYRNLLK